MLDSLNFLMTLANVGVSDPNQVVFNFTRKIPDYAAKRTTSRL
jgi:hypothetical protein